MEDEIEIIEPKKTPKKRGKKFSKRGLAPNEEKMVAQGNQWQATERQLDWLNLYMNPKEEETYANPYQAAIKAGYSESYARNIMSPSTALQWVQAAKNIMRTMNTEHIRGLLEDIATSRNEDTKDRLTAIKMLGTDQGMFVQKNITAHVGLEEALQNLE